MVTIEEISEAQVLFGKARRAILALLFMRTDQSFYLREIERLSGLGIGPVQRELRKLVKCGLVKRSRAGKQVYFKANESSPIYHELRSIIVKTVGIGDLIKSALTPMIDKIEFTFIYGSFAKGTESGRSDIDLMVIGDVKHKEIVKAVSESQKTLMREINPSIYTRDDFTGRLRKGNTFISSVIKSEKIMLIGEEDELGLLG